MTKVTSTIPTVQMVDRNHAMEAIKQKYGPRYDIQSEALWEAAALWGVTMEANLINDSGVFLHSDTLLQLSTGSFQIEINGVNTPNQLWLMSLCCQSSIQGHGYACSVWHPIAYPTCEDACLAGIQQILEHFYRQEATGRNLDSNAYRKERVQMIRLLEAEQTPQLTLF